MGDIPQSEGKNAVLIGLDFNDASVVAIQDGFGRDVGFQRF